VVDRPPEEVFEGAKRVDGLAHARQPATLQSLYPGDVEFTEAMGG
jgi:hypothetical protein